MLTSTQSFDIIVVGGGIAGLMTAWFLRRQNLHIALIERGHCGAESSWAGGGIIFPTDTWKLPDPVFALILYSQELWPRICRELKEMTAIDSELRWTGMLLFTDEDRARRVEAWTRKHDFPFERARAGDLRALAPALRYSPDQLVFWFPRVPQVRNPSVLKAMIAALRREKNISLFENTPVQRLDIAGGCVAGVASANLRFKAPKVVLALGAWAGQPPEGAPGSDIYPVRGQMLAYEGDRRFFYPVIGDGCHYMIPRSDGVVLAGSTLEDKGFDKEVTEEARSAIHEFVSDICPDLAARPLLRHWSGLRPGRRSSRPLPLIGPDPNTAGLYHHGGLYRNGLGVAPATASICAAQIVGEKPPLDPQPYGIVSQP